MSIEGNHKPIADPITELGAGSSRDFGTALSAAPCIETCDRRRASISLMEEPGAVDRYQQRVDVWRDPELQSDLAHKRSEDNEPAAKVLEWIRRRDPVKHKALRDSLLKTGEIGHA